MSFNQSRAEKSESHYRKPRRSGNSAYQRVSSGVSGKSGGGTGLPPASSTSQSSSFSTNRSFKKSNGQGWQTRVTAASVESESSAVQNAAPAQPSLSGASNAAVSDASVKPTDLPNQRSNQTLPRVPSSQSASGTSDSTAPATPVKGDASRGVSLQFGSFSPGLVNGMQIPARTSSAPPNLDEQKRDQAQHDSSKSLPILPASSSLSQQQPREAGEHSKSKNRIPHPVPQPKRDVHAQLSVAPVVTNTPNSSTLPVSGVSMTVPFQQSHFPIQIGVPSPQIQAQGMTATSLHMPMPLPVRNATQMRQPVFVPGLQPHPLQPQGLMHRGQGLNLPPQIGHQLGSQLGNVGGGIMPQFAQQHAGKFGSRISVKITHPETREELRLDKRADMNLDGGSHGPGSNFNVPLQPQPVPYGPSHQINYFSHMQTSPIFFQSPSSLPLTSTQIPSSSQASGFDSGGGQGSQILAFKSSSSVNPISVASTDPGMRGMAVSSNVEHAFSAEALISAASSPSIQAAVKPAAGSIGEKVSPSSVSVASAASDTGEVTKLLRPRVEVSSLYTQGDLKLHPEISVQQSKSVPELAHSVSSSLTTAHSVKPSASVSVERLPTGDAVSMAISSDGWRTETARRLDANKDQLKKPSKKYQQHSQSQRQAENPDSADDSTMKALREDAKCLTDMQDPPLQEVEPPTSISTRPLLGVVSTVSEDRISGTVKCKAIPASSETSGDVLVAIGESFSNVHADVSVASIEGADSVHIGDGSICETSNKSNVETIVDYMNGDKLAKLDDFTPSDIELKEGIIGSAEQGKTGLCQQPQVDYNYENDKANISADSLSFKSSKIIDQTEDDLNNKKTAFCNETATSESELNVLEGAAGSGGLENDKTGLNLVSSTASSLDRCNSDPSPHNLGSSKDCSEVKTLSLEASKSCSGCIDGHKVSLLESGETHQDSALIPIPLASVMVSDLEEKISVKANDDSVLVPSWMLKDKPMLELNRVKSVTSKGKKKRKEILQKADAAGTTTDLYMAYKGPDEKPQASISSESVDSNSSISQTQISSNSIEEDVAAKEDQKSKAEPDDWEDAADIPTPKLEISDSVEEVHGSLRRAEEDEAGTQSKKRYSRDFLLTFLKQCTDLPAGFDIAHDMVEALMGFKASMSKLGDRNSLPSLGRIVDRPCGVSRADYHGSVMMDDEKWIKSPGPVASGQDPRVEVGQGGNAFGFRHGQGGNLGVSRNLSGQTPGQYVGRFPSGPLLPPAYQGGTQRNGPDADRWQRAAGFQKGLIPSPRSTLQVMHKAAKKYEVGKVDDVEEAKQRQLKAILNKLTPQNFDRLFEQVKEVNIDNAVTLTGVISQIFDKALMEPTFCEMYANFCYHLAGELPDFVDDNEKITFKRLLLNKCQEEFLRGEREQAEADSVEGDGEVKQLKGEREEKRLRVRRRMLGNIRLIGELYKKKMLTERIMHECIKKLLGQYENPDEEDIEALCKLMSTIGEMIDHPKAKEHIDAYFEMMKNLSNNMRLSSRVRFMLKDSIDLRKSKWQQRRKVEGPKKIEELHKDAAQERQAQNSRLARGPSFSSSARRGQPMDFGPRASAMLSPPRGPMGAFRASQIHGYGNQSSRVEGGHPFENRTFSVPLPRRSINDNTITLGPQGGLAKGMSVRGHPMLSGAPLANTSTGPGEPRRMPAGPNGYTYVSERTPYNSSQEPMSRYVQERLQPPAHDMSNSQGYSMHYVNRDISIADCSSDRSMAGSPNIHVQRSSAGIPNVSSGKVWPEEHLTEMSRTAIREFYSARDENEVALCIRDLNSPSFNPSMISIWINDSFERKDRDRDLLAGLLVNLTMSRDGILNTGQLIEGFQSVLATLEDAVTDAPKAAEFLGRIFARIILANFISLKEIGQLIQRGGEEPGHLVQSGLGYEVLESAFGIIRSEKGESVLKEICRSSDIKLEDFRHSGPAK